MMAVFPLLFNACQSDSTGTDGDYDTENEQGDTENYDTPAETDADRVEGEETRPRRVVAETLGFCTQPYPLDQSCNTVADCVGMRVPVPVDCQSESLLVNGLDCVFANRLSHPPNPDCSADDTCQEYPRDCIDGKCVYVPAPDQCRVNEDCTLVKRDCACFAIATDQAPDFAPQLGASCLSGECPEDSYALCIEGRCRIAGTFMDAAVRTYCELLVSCLSQQTDAQQCVDSMLAEDRKLAAAQAPLIKAALLAETCAGFIGGPGVALYQCLFSTGQGQ